MLSNCLNFEEEQNKIWHLCAFHFCTKAIFFLMRIKIATPTVPKNRIIRESDSSHHCYGRHKLPPRPRRLSVHRRHHYSLAARAIDGRPERGNTARNAREEEQDRCRPCSRDLFIFLAFPLMQKASDLIQGKPYQVKTVLDQ